MKFSDLAFDQAGCCGTHAWAEVPHANGKTSFVYDNGGSYSVVTRAAGMVMRGQEEYATPEKVETRLAEDAA